MTITPEDLDTIVEAVLQRINEAKDSKPHSSGDYRVSDIARITGMAYGTCAGLRYYGEYWAGKTRLIQKVEFDYRRKTGQSVAIGK